MAKLPRDEQLVRASKTRAAIVGFLNQHGDGVTPVTQDAILPLVEPLGITPSVLGNTLYRMAKDGLIAKHDVEHEHYRVGYTSNPVWSASADKAAVVKPVKYKRKVTTEGAPIDVRVNEAAGIITIRYAGMVLSFSKE